MSHNIYASFENRDAAERAAIQLKRKGIACRFAIAGDGGADTSPLRTAQASMSLLFPYYPPQYSSQFTNMPTPRTIGKAVFTADTLGLPIYPGSSTARVRVTVDDEQLYAARSILINCGGYDLA